MDGVNEEAGPEPKPPPGEPVHEGTPVTAVAVSPDVPSDVFGWSVQSADGSAEVRQGRVSEGQEPARCTTSSTVTPPNGEPRRVMWKWDTCIATRSQLKFVSPDGQRVLVLDPLPAPVGARGLDAEGVTLYEQGLRVKFLRVGAAVEDLEARRWVKGVAGHLGVPPAYSADGSGITFESLAGRAFTLGFDGRGFPPAAEDVRSFMAAEGLYRYQDAQGTTQVVNSVDHIPERYRDQARSVKARVSVQPAPKPPAAPADATASAGKKPVPGAKSPRPTQAPSKDPINEARETVEKVQEIRREQERILKTLH